MNWKKPRMIGKMEDAEFFCIQCYKKVPLQNLRIPQEFTWESGVLICEDCQKTWGEAESKKWKRTLTLCWGKEASEYLEEEEVEHE